MFGVKVIVCLAAIWFTTGTDSSVIFRNTREVNDYLDLFRVKRDAPVDTPVNATTAPVASTTFDWHQYTRTYPTSGPVVTGNVTQAPVASTTYDWHQWTRTYPTYPTYEPVTGTGLTDDPSVTTENPQTTTESHAYRCPAGKYSCKGTIGLCVGLDQICDGKQDCPHRDDEDKRVCFPGYVPRPRAKHQNTFAGTGFMFGIRNLLVKQSQAKLFNQFSDNLAAQKSQQNM